MKHTRHSLILAAGGVSLAAGLVAPVAFSSPSAGAQSTASLRQQADVLAAEIQTDYAKLQVLDESFNQAHAKVVHLRSQVRQAAAGIIAAEHHLGTDRRHLRNMALEAYVESNNSEGLALLMSSGGSSNPMRQAYLNAASGTLSQAEANVVTAEHSLTDKRTTLVGAERGARRTEQKIGAERALASEITAQLESELSSVKGKLTAAVAAAEHTRLLQQEATARAEALARSQHVHRSHPTYRNYGNVGGGAGSVAVRAAESQLGVPYVWGGDTPGVGFDCSGLTMWAWGQAGVSLAHGATEQYYEIAHVSMNDLRPGDLIFYGSSGYLYHVVMYVGSGPYGADTVIQAENFGTDVMFTPIPAGAYGAGRP